MGAWCADRPVHACYRAAGEQRRTGPSPRIAAAVLLGPVSGPSGSAQTLAGARHGTSQRQQRQRLWCAVERSGESVLTRARGRAPAGPGVGGPLPVKQAAAAPTSAAGLRAPSRSARPRAPTARCTGACRGAACRRRRRWRRAPGARRQQDCAAHVGANESACLLLGRDPTARHYGLERRMGHFPGYFARLS